jgi:peptidoglycan hydrolase FlgJ
MANTINNITAAEFAAADQSQRLRTAGKGQTSEKQKAEIKKVSKEFEALFVGMMMKSMRATVGKDSVTGGGHGEEMYRSLLDQEYANAAAQGGGFGIARMIEQQLERYNGSDVDNGNRKKQ